jgi:hypothetical protein
VKKCRNKLKTKQKNRLCLMNNLNLALSLINENHGVSKAQICALLVSRFGLTQDRSVYYCADFAIRFSHSKSQSFSNTVLSLSNLRKYDHQPFLVCLSTPTKIKVFIANSTFLKKISHSSQELRVDNIRGSFNGSDIIHEFERIENTSENVERLFNIHFGIGFEGNLARLVEATNNISPTGVKFEVTPSHRKSILGAPKRAASFVGSNDFKVLKKELDRKVEKHKKEILLAALIENVNIRGRVIEYIIASEDDRLRADLISAIKAGTNKLPDFKTDNTLGDYQRIFDSYETETDVKTKIMILNSNPKAYNLDKMLEFMAREKSVFMFYFVGVDPGKIIDPVLISIFQIDLLQATILLKHWAGRNSRGVSQFEGKVISQLIEKQSNQIDESKAVAFLEKLMSL